MVYHEEITLRTKAYQQLIPITAQVLEIAGRSGVGDGLVTVQTLHTTTGITVNESLECLESDIGDFLSGLAPEERPYHHARMLRDYGSTAGNPTGHLKALVTGSHCHLPLRGGAVVRGGAQELYFCEFDGPAARTILVTVMGEPGGEGGRGVAARSGT